MAQPPAEDEKQSTTGGLNRATSHLAERGASREIAGRLLDTVRRAGGNQVVARRSGIPLATVNNYVRGRNGMKIGPLAAMAQACTVSLEWLVFGDVSPARRAGADYPTASTDPPPGLGETPVAPFTAGDIDQRALAKAIEIVVVIAGAEDFREDTKGVARRIAATYAKLTEPEAPPG